MKNNFLTGIKNPFFADKYKSEDDSLKSSINFPILDGNFTSSNNIDSSRFNYTISWEELKNLVLLIVEETGNQNFKKVEEKLYTREEVLSKFQICPATLCTWQKNGIIIPKKLGNRVYYPESEINRLSRLK